MKITALKNLLFLFVLLSLLYCTDTSNKTKTAPSKNINYNKAGDYRDSGNYDSAFIYYSFAKNDFLKINDTLGITKSLINMAIIQTDNGDFFGGIETSLEAEKFLKKNDSITNQLKSSNYNNLALANDELENFDNAQKYYNLALNTTQDNESKYIYYNNIGNTFLGLKNYQKARENYTKALQTKDSISYARTLNNIGRSYFLENKNANVLPYFLNSLKIRESKNDLWGLNSSYATLADYYKEKDAQKSLFYANKMYEIARKINNPDDQLEALQKIIFLENPIKSKELFKKYDLLKDSVQIERNKAKNQFALIRYETEKNKIENEKLKTEKAEKENKILRQNFLLLLLSIGIVAFYFWYKRRKKLLQLEKENEIRNTELRYSKKVHDVVANGLYQTMVEIQNKEKIEKENLLDQLENLYEKSRDISHEKTEEEVLLEYSEKLSAMLTSYSCEKTQILIAGNSENIWKPLSEKKKKELFYILQELMVNMKKHSSANLVVLKFEKNQENIFIKYTDNGIGIQNFEKKSGSGIHNMEIRIATINGVINFEKNPKGGLIVTINISI